MGRSVHAGGVKVRTSVGSRDLYMWSASPTSPGSDMSKSSEMSVEATHSTRQRWGPLRYVAFWRLLPKLVGADSEGKRDNGSGKKKM